MNRRGFFKLLAAAIATPIARKILPASVQANIQDRINARMAAVMAKMNKDFADALFVESPFMVKMREHYPEGFKGGDHISVPLLYRVEDEDSWDGNA